WFKGFDKQLATIIAIVVGIYSLLFWSMATIEVVPQKQTVKDLPKRLKQVLVDAGIEKALKKQQSAIGQMIKGLDGGRARGEEGKAKAEKARKVEEKSSPKVAK